MKPKPQTCSCIPLTWRIKADYALRKTQFPFTNLWSFNVAPQGSNKFLKLISCSSPSPHSQLKRNEISQRRQNLKSLKVSKIIQLLGGFGLKTWKRSYNHSSLKRMYGFRSSVMARQSGNFMSDVSWKINCPRECYFATLCVSEARMSLWHK